MKFTPFVSRLLRLFGVLLVLSAACTGYYLIFGHMSDAEKAKLLLETAKTLLEIITTIFVGYFVVEVLLKSVDRNRKKDKALHDFRVDILGKLEEAHEHVQKARSDLRVIGLTTAFGAPPNTMDERQRGEYSTTMRTCQDVQFSLQRLKLELGHFPDSFRSNADLDSSVGKMIDYVGKLLEEYEKHAPSLREAANRVTFATLVKLNDFTGGQNDSSFQKEFEVSHDRALAVIRQELLPLKLVLTAGSEV
jgi:hypothetical protein